MIPDLIKLHYKIMQNQTIIGIDVSSATLDICVSNDQNQRSFVIKNDIKSIRKFFSSFKEQLIICMENTGRYNWNLYEAFKQTEHRIFVVSPLHLKKSMGLVRGKNDKIDAVRIAAFIRKNHAELPQWKPSSETVQKLKILLTERNSRIKTKRQLLKQQYDYAKMKHLGMDKYLMKMNEQQLKLINQQIKSIETDIEAIIRADASAYEQVKLIRSIPGVGKVLSWMMLAKTECFQVITEARKMACYSGVVPFAYQSGTSIRGRHQVSTYADKAIKTVLHLAAMSAIRLKNDLQEYYQRKVAEGKNRMSALNAVRNKIVHRIFAIIKSKEPYKNDLLLS